MLDAMTLQANPSSVHSSGRKARKLVETARTDIANAIGARSADLIFTSGGTEANGLALHGVLSKVDEPVLFYSDLEHPAVRDIALSGKYKTENVRVTSHGVIDLVDLAAKLENLETSQTPVLTLMLANNETGVLQPVFDAAAIVRERRGLVHCDAVQGLGKIPVNVALLNVDVLTLSAHKLGGPQGVGAVWVAPGLPLLPQQIGGGQEQSRRSGTENLIGIAGFAAAVCAALQSKDDAQLIRDMFEAELSDTGCQFVGAEQNRLPNTSCLLMDRFKGETQVMALDLAGFAVSSGSACSSGKVRPSSVLVSMGFNDDIAQCALRVSFGWNSKLEDAKALANAWLKAARRAVPERFKELA